MAAGIARLVERARGIVADRRERRMEQFHVELLAGMPKEEARAIIETIETDEAAATEYAALLEKVWRDDDEAKTGLYARLLRFLLTRSDVDARTRPHLVRAVGELAASDVDVLKTAFRIGGRWPADKALQDGTGRVVLDGSPERQDHFQRQTKFLEESDPLTLAGIQRLELAGFLQRVSTGGGDRIEVTPLGQLLLQAVEAKAKDR